MEKKLYVYKDDYCNNSILKLTEQEAKVIMWFLNTFLDEYDIYLSELSEKVYEVES